MQRASAVLVVVLLAHSAGLAQKPPDPNDPVIRITTTLIQIDAVVTDKKGKPVTGLTKQDFQIFQDGQPRDLTYFNPVIVTQTLSGLRTPQAPKKGELPAPASATASVARQQIHRTVVIMVNDLGMEFAEMAQVRSAVRKFVAEDIQDGDMVAIVRASGGMGIYSQFTTNREILKAAADSIRYVFRTGPASGGRGGIVRFQLPRGMLGDLQSASTGAIIRALDRMKEMPGRKSMVLFLGGSGSYGPQMERIANAATRAAVSIYPIDARGVPTFASAGGNAAQNARPEYNINQFGASPRALFAFSQYGMTFLADYTGGVAYVNDNGMGHSLRQALDDQSSYYLLGYDPGPGSFNQQFHKIQVKVLRPGLKVRSRTGYEGYEESTPVPAAESLDTKMVREVLAPFQTTEIRTRLHAFFRTDQNAEQVQSDLLIDANDLKFERGDDGLHRAKIEVVVANFDTRGALAEHTEKSYGLSLTDQEWTDAQEFGLSFQISYPVAKAGPYEVRAGVSDLQSGKLGTASQFLTVPDLSRNQLALSGVMLTEAKTERQPHLLLQPLDSVFRPGSNLSWQAQVFRPKMKDGTAKLSSRLRIFRDGKQVSETVPIPIDASMAKKQLDVIASGSLPLNKDLKPGDYTLQLLVQDENDGPNLVAQSVDFRIVD